MTSRVCGFVPPYLLEHLARHNTLMIDNRMRRVREGIIAAPPAPELTAAWVVHDCHNGTVLPGDPARSAGEPPTGDPAVDEAAYGIEGSLALFAEVFRRRSYDGRGVPVSLSVHYEQGYDNAFWDGTQLVFGDGDGIVFGRFTRAVDVLGHEFSHAVIEHTAGLRYQGQSGALNESVADVFASCLKQRLLGQSPDEADWLIGTELFVEGIHARGLRDMLNPGTAYDDPALGRDPQPAHMDSYVETRDDNGGVHINSGIPNRAFALAAIAIGGSAAEGAGRIWYAALTGTDVGPATDFAGFAAACVAAAGEHEDAVAQAWQQVGVTPGAAAGGQPADTDLAAAASSTVVSVRRTGGLAGRVAENAVDLTTEEDERAAELRALVDRVDLRAVAGKESRGADRFVYDFDLCGDCASVGEERLTTDLRRIVDLVLSAGSDRR